MGSENKVGKTKQLTRELVRVRRRLGGKHVERGPRELIREERTPKRGKIDNLTSAQIEHIAPRTHPAQLGFADHTSCLRSSRHVQSKKIGSTEYLVFRGGSTCASEWKLL